MKNYKKPAVEELRKKLTDEQFHVTQEEGTERPFKNVYWDNHEAGIYVDIVSGEPLFSSLDKFDSGTGWPSFVKPLAKENIVEKEDKRLFFQTRVEVRSKHADSHLGHVFPDGPAPTGLRYCMNSASLRFIPVDKLQEQGYSEFLPLFAKANATSANEKAIVTAVSTAVFAGGCFWCLQPPFDALQGQGVLKTVVGYTGGKKAAPTYEEVSSGQSGHLEAIEITYDPKKIDYQRLLEIFWMNVDPTNAAGQFCDNGEQYTSAIFVQDAKQKLAAEASKEKIVEKLQVKEPIVTKIVEAGKFYPAEDYHQDYYKKNPVRYKFYRYNCGRDQRLKQLWGKTGH